MSLSEDDILIDACSALNIDDVVGSRVDNVDGASTSTVVLEIYPLVKNRRTRRTERVMFPSSNDAQQFHSVIQRNIRKRLPQAKDKDEKSTLSATSHGAHDKCSKEDAKGTYTVPAHLLKTEANNRVLVLINPFSGQKRAEKLWIEHGAPVLDAAGIETDVLHTEYPRHATKIMLDLDIDRYDAVLVNSGDGLVTEVICGLLLRKDRARALKLPVCHIPGGTSNALAAAICYACNEPFSPRNLFIVECCLMATRPLYIPLRLYTVETQHDGIRPMFMSANWGLIADIDLGSERFRWAGMIRLHMEAVLRIMQLPTVATYRARLSYIPVNCKRTSRNTMLKFNCDRKEFGGGHFDYENVDQATGLEMMEKEHFSTMREALQGCSLVDIPPLNQPLPEENWQVVEGDWVMANVSTMSHLGSDIPFLPSARLDETIMYLTLIDWNTIKTRLHIAHLFVFMESSTHLRHPCMQIIPVRAVRVEPLSTDGYFAIDGEPCRSGSSFQVVPSKFCATVTGRKQVTK